MADGDPLPADGHVYRVPTIHHTRICDEGIQVTLHMAPGERAPLPDAFTLSPAERQLRDMGQRVTISVWDAAKITPAQALAVRGVGAGRGPYFVYTLAVVDIHAIGRATGLALAVVEDRAGAPQSASDALAAAHAGIAGLDQGPKLALKSARRQLADICRPVAP